MEKGKISTKITVIIIAVVFYGFAILCYIKPADSISLVERRELATVPDLNLKAVASGKFMDEFEEYAVDQIPFRQAFRTVRSLYGYILLAQLDTNDLYMCHGYIQEMDYPMNETSLDWAAERFSYVYDKYLKNKNANIYLSIIPDKNYFNCDDRYLTYDYEELVRKMCDSMEYAEYIDIMNMLKREDYYRTDSHWRQEALVPVAEYIGDAMGVDVSTEYEEVVATDSYAGVYYGQIAIPMKRESIVYLTNDTIKECTVYDCEHNKSISMYDLEAGEGDDPYELYLYGPLSLITIDNPNATTDRELVIFRDSFGSSIAPLLIEGYSSITLVDIRYIQSQYVGEFVDFEHKDVLFLYNTAVLNNSETIK